MSERIGISNNTKIKTRARRSSSSSSRVKGFVIVLFFFLVSNTIYLIWVSEHEIDLQHHQHNANHIHVPNPYYNEGDPNTKLSQDHIHRIVKGNGHNKGNDNINGDTDKEGGSSSSSSSSLLNCDAYGGPYDKLSLDEMVYWKEIPSDWKYNQFKFSSTTSNTNRSANTHRNTNDTNTNTNTNTETPDTTQYLTFDTDLSGFNNQRMVFEINIAMAIATGRTLVLPRKRYIDHMPTKNGKATTTWGKHDKNTDKKNTNGMEDFFDVAAISQRLSSSLLTIMSFDEFLHKEGIPSKLNIPTNFTNWKTTDTKRVVSVSVSETEWYTTHFLTNNTQLRCTPHTDDDDNDNDKNSKRKSDDCSNFTSWIDEKHVVKGQYKYYIDEFFHFHPQINAPSTWGASMCAVVIPSSLATSSSSSVVSNTNTLSSIALTLGNQTNNLYQQLVGRPIPVNATISDRLKEIYNNVSPSRNGVCLYDTVPSHPRLVKSIPNLPQSKYYHMRDDPTRNQRLMAHWYDYILFENYHDDLWMKRFMRDQLKYNNEIQCCAARIIHSIRMKSTQLLGPEQNGIYHAMHIRRTDMTTMYQNRDIDRTAKEIYHDFQHEIPHNTSIVYIATDEKDKHYFDVMRDNYQRVYFLEDFIQDECPTLVHKKDYYGMLDQLICAKGTHFIGQYYSTFTGYINRLRGYHSQHQQNAAQTQQQKQPTKQQQQQQQQVQQQQQQNLGIIPSWFYSPTKKRNIYQQYAPIAETTWAMEYPIGWRDIDFDVVTVPVPQQ